MLEFLFYDQVEQSNLGLFLFLCKMSLRSASILLINYLRHLKCIFLPFFFFFPYFFSSFLSKVSAKGLMRPGCQPNILKVFL